jgi:hypothetical protein
MPMPLSNVHVVHFENGFVAVYDGERLLCEIGPNRSTGETDRIANLIEELLSNHGANDDTTGLYDDDEGEWE